MKRLSLIAVPFCLAAGLACAEVPNAYNEQNEATIRSDLTLKKADGTANHVLTGKLQIIFSGYLKSGTFSPGKACSLARVIEHDARETAGALMDSGDQDNLALAMEVMLAAQKPAEQFVWQNGCKGPEAAPQ